MRVFSVPVSAPLLRTVIAALVDGRLVEGFEARSAVSNHEASPVPFILRDARARSSG